MCCLIVSSVTAYSTPTKLEQKKLMISTGLILKTESHEESKQLCLENFRINDVNQESIDRRHQI